MKYGIAALATLLIFSRALMAENGAPRTVRVATFNIQELSWKKLQPQDGGQAGTHPQLQAAAGIIQTIRPDVPLINEIDYSEPASPSTEAPEGSAAEPAETRNAVGSGSSSEGHDVPGAFLQQYLMVGQNGAEPIEYAYRFYAPSNTGVPSGLDLNGNGKTDEPNDAFGFGRYPGEYGMVLFSRFPLNVSDARTFQQLLWKDVPGNLMPDGSGGKPEFYQSTAAAVFRLSSKSHWDVPVQIGGHTIHLLCSHPTPPIFDGPEDANGRRNFDEIRFWRDYLSSGKDAAWIHDDQNRSGGLDEKASFVILGDLNADPWRSDPLDGTRAADLILGHPRVQDPLPASAGAVSSPDRSSDAEHRRYRTARFGRLDYALPSRDLQVTSSAVYWPDASDPVHESVQKASDHRLVWVDLKVL